MTINQHLRLLLLATLALFVVLPGCQPARIEIPPKAPRPVTTMELNYTTPTSIFEVSGSVQSWKTERIAFEVPGRLLRVEEPGRNVAPPGSDDEENGLEEQASGTEEAGEDEPDTLEKPLAQVNRIPRL